MWSLSHSQFDNFGQNCTSGLWISSVSDIPSSSHPWNDSYICRWVWSVLGVGILQLPFSLAIVILGPIAGIIAAKYGGNQITDSKRSSHFTILHTFDDTSFNS